LPIIFKSGEKKTDGVADSDSEDRDCDEVTHVRWGEPGDK